MAAAEPSGIVSPPSLAVAAWRALRSGRLVAGALPVLRGSVIYLVEAVVPAAWLPEIRLKLHP